MDDQYTKTENALVGVLMGSASDWPTMQAASEMLDQFDVAHECNAISAHRQPARVVHYCTNVEERGLKVLICAAGGAAHLAGIVAAHTSLPVLGCPMQAWALDGLDSLLSTVQMPKGVPVATFAIGKAGAINAALFAVQLLALTDDELRSKLKKFRVEQSSIVSALPKR